VTEVFAHRGLHQVERENTVAAFLAARAAGAHGVELDVRLSADGALVIHHDPLIGGRPVSQTPWREMPDYVPSLAGAMGACASMSVNVEIKNSLGEPGYDPTGALATRVVEVLHEGSWAERCVVSSFDLATCRRVVEVDPGLLVGLLVEPGCDLADALARAAEAGCRALHPYVADVDAAAVAHARELGLALNVWTVNERHDLEAMIGLEVACVITDDPVGALELLAAGPGEGSEPVA
jgi:glycerophosphoryl diester phosphodiesterase